MPWLPLFQSHPNTAAAALLTGPADLSGLATFGPGVHTGLGALIVGPADLSGLATFGPGVHTGLGALIVGPAELSGLATRTIPPRVATAALVVGPAELFGSSYPSPPPHVPGIGNVIYGIYQESDGRAALAAAAGAITSYPAPLPGIRCRLYRNPGVPTPQSLTGAFVEADWPGYSSAVVWAEGKWIGPDDRPTLYATVAPWLWGLPTDNQTVYGWYLTETAGAAWYAAAPFRVPILLDQVNEVVPFVIALAPLP